MDHEVRIEASQRHAPFRLGYRQPAGRAPVRSDGGRRAITPADRA